MRNQNQGKRVRRKNRTPVELYAFGLIAVMWAAIIIGAIINKPTTLQDVPQQVPTQAVQATPQPLVTVKPEPVEFVEVVEAINSIEITPEPEPISEPTHDYYDCPFDQDKQDFIYDRMEQFHINLDLSWALAAVWNESTFDQYACGKSNDQGYLQLIPSTYRMVYKRITKEFPELNLVDNPYDFHTNVACGLYYMWTIAQAYDMDEVNEDNIHQVLTCYNRGVTGGGSYHHKYETWTSSYSKRIAAAQEVIFTTGSAYNINLD